MTNTLSPMHTFTWKDGTAEHSVTLTLDQARTIHADLAAFIRVCEAKPAERVAGVGPDHGGAT